MVSLSNHVAIPSLLPPTQPLPPSPLMEEGRGEGEKPSANPTRWLRL